MKQDDRKPEQTVLLNGIPYTGDAAASGKQKNRRRRWKWLTAVSVLTIAMLVPASAHAGIFDVFGELFGTIQSDIGSSLKSINQLTQQVQQLYQTTMWPLAALNQARGFVANSITAFRSQMNQIFSTQFTSAVTAGPKQFESILHNHRMLSADAGISLIKSLPADRLLTETDAPFTEIENRKSEPRDVIPMISRLAQLRNLPLGDMKRIVTANSERVLAFAGVRIQRSDW